MQPHEKIKRACKPPHPTVQEFMRTSNSGAMNVNRFVESVCGHEQNRFVGTAPHAHNRVARPTQDYVGGGSHTTVHAGHAYSGSLSCGATFK